MIVVVATGTARLGADDHPDLLAAPATVAPRSAEPAMPVPVPESVVELPTPEPLPLDPYADTADIQLGAIEIPRLGVLEVLWQGMTLTAIDRGPSHWPGTALPGQAGNVVVAGHRSTHSRPFRHLDALVPGDIALFHTGDGTFVYEVTGTEIVTPETTSIADQTPDHTATFFACHPVGSARERIVVHLSEVRGAEQSTGGPQATLAA